MMHKAQPVPISGDDAPGDDAAGGSRLRIDTVMAEARWQPLCAPLHAQAHFVWRALDLPAAELSLVLADDARLAQLNKTYRGKAGATNVLSFPAHDFAAPVGADDFPAPPVMLGDIVLAYATMRREAALADKTLEAHARHLLTHGLLHLLGHDHIAPRDGKIMQALESRLLLAAGQPDPYATSPHTPDPHASGTHASGTGGGRMPKPSPPVSKP